MLDSWLRDLRYAVRRLSRRLTYTGLAVLTLSLGVAGTAAVFSIVEQLLLEPLPAAEEERIEVFWMGGSWSEAEFLHLRPEIASFESLASFAIRDATLRLEGGPARLVHGVASSAELFDVLGVQPLIGGGFRAGDDRPGAQPAVILSHAFWRELGADPAIVGTTLELSGVMRTVAGVMPEGFWFPDPRTEIWMTNQLDTDDYSGNWSLIGKRRDGVSRADAHGELPRIMEFMHARFDYAEGEWDKRANPTLTPLREHLTGSMRPALLATLGAMALILVIACVNVAALMLGQVDRRETEIAVRSALGAGRMQILRQLLIESMTIGLLAGLAGAGLAWLGFRFLTTALPLGGLAEAAKVDWALFGAAIAIAVVASTLIALAPAVSVVRSDVQKRLTRSRTGGIGGRGGSLEAALVVAQVALVLLMTASAGLLLRSVSRLRSIDPGVDVEGIAVIDVLLPVTIEPAARPGLIAELARAVDAVPGVASAGVTQRLPLRGSSDNWGIAIEAQPDLEQTTTAFRIVTPDYFRTMGIALRSGRLLDESDRRADLEEGTVVINQELADRYFPGRDPIGQRIGFMRGRWDRIVGVVENVAEAGLSREPVPARYLTYEQVPYLLPTQAIAIRAEEGADLAVLLDAARVAIQRTEPGAAIQETTTMELVFDRAVGPARQVMQLLAMLGALALVLGAIGVFGVVSHFVTRRRRDWGIRVALGMQPVSVLRRIVAMGVALVASGAAAGTIAFLVLSRLLSSFLFEIGSADPIALGGAAAILLAAGAVAAWFPAHRTSRLDPSTVLREQ